MGANNESEVWDPVLITESRGRSWTSHRMTLGRWCLSHLLVQFRDRRV